MELKNKTIVVWFSCGAASAVAVKKAIEIYGNDNDVIVVNTPIKEEHSDNLRFLKDVQKWIGQDIITAVNPKYPNSSIMEVFKQENYMSSIKFTACTYHLKKEARYHFETKINIDYHILGFTLEEKARQYKFSLERKTIPLLIDLEITKSMCFHILEENNIKLPEIYSLGFPHANCIGCVRATSPTYWNLVRTKFPEVFTEREEQSKEIGAKLVRVKGKRIYLEDLTKYDMGAKLKDIDSYDCGLFCNEYN